MFKKSIFKFWIALALITMIGLTIRFYNLREKSLYIWDEGVFYQSGAFVHYRLHQQFPGVFNEPASNSWKYVNGISVPGFPTFLWKPFHVLLTFIFLVLFDYKDYSGPLMSLFFAGLTIPAIYCLGSIIKNQSLGLLSAL